MKEREPVFVSKRKKIQREREREREPDREVGKSYDTEISNFICRHQRYLRAQ